MPLVATPSTIPNGPVTVATALTNPAVVLTYTPAAGTSTVQITSITSSNTTTGITYSYPSSNSVIISGAYSMALFDQNFISCIPRGGTDKDIPSTVTVVNSFTDIQPAGANARQVFKLIPDVRVITVVYTITCTITTVILAIAAVPPATTGTAGSTVVTTGVTTPVTQTVINDYDVLSAALLLVI